MSHINSLVVYYVTERAVVMRTGPDDARHVVLAIGKSFSFSFVFFLILTIVFIVYYVK